MTFSNCLYKPYRYRCYYNIPAHMSRDNGHDPRYWSREHGHDHFLAAKQAHHNKKAQIHAAT